MFPRAFFVIGGRTYRWSGWFGCQLESMEWLVPFPGTTRILDFGVNGAVEVTVFSARREWVRVRTTWAVSKQGSIDEQSTRIRALKELLKGLI
jgi:hypothetical protein